LKLKAFSAECLTRCRPTLPGFQLRDTNGKMTSKPQHPAGLAMTLGNMRELGV